MIRRIQVAALVLVLAAACDEGNDVGREARAPVAGEVGITVLVPPGWHTAPPDDGRVLDPKTRLVVSSAPIRTRSVACQIARYAPPRDGVTVVVVEWQQSDVTAPPRPRRFTERALPFRTGAIECFGGAGGSAEFQVMGRVFGAYVLLGRRASRTLADSARGVLDTLVVRRAAAFGRPARFASLPRGWRQRNSGVASRHSDGLNTWTTATSWDYRPDAFGPVGQIPRDGILTQVLLIRRSGYPRMNAAAEAIVGDVEGEHFID